jgi:hypothetical protein
MIPAYLPFNDELRHKVLAAAQESKDQGRGVITNNDIHSIQVAPSAGSHFGTATATELIQSRVDALNSLKEYKMEPIYGPEGKLVAYKKVPLRSAEKA